MKGQLKMKEEDYISGQSGDQALEEELNDDSIVTIYDEEGNPIDCDLLDFIDYEGKKYVVLLPYGDDESEESDGNVIILAIEDGGEIEDEATLESVDDGELLQKLFDIFKEKNADIYDFEED